MRKKGKYFIEQKRNISKSFPFADGAKVEFTMTTNLNLSFYSSSPIDTKLTNPLTN